MNEIIRQRKGTKMELELHEAFDIVVDESASQWVRPPQGVG